MAASSGVDGEAAGSGARRPAWRVVVILAFEVERPDRLYHSRHRSAAAWRSSGVDGLGGPEPFDLAAEQLEAQPGAVTTSSSSLGYDQGVDQRRDDVEVAGVGQCPGGDPPHARVAVGQHLAEPDLVRPQHAGPSA